MTLCRLPLYPSATDVLLRRFQRSRPPVSFERAARKKAHCDGKRSAVRPAARAEAGADQQEAAQYATQIQSRSQVHVRHPARCAETELSKPQMEAGERGFYYPGDKSLYASLRGHGERAERVCGTTRRRRRLLNRTPQR